MVLCTRTTNIGRWTILTVFLLVTVISSVNAYSKFGRSCKDIGCLSQETCVMAHESCSYSQRDGKDCGSYPTCKRNPNGGGSDVSSAGDLDDLVPQHKPPTPPRREHAEPAPAPAYPDYTPGGGNLYPALNPGGGGGGYVNPGGYTPPGYNPPASDSDYYGGGGGHHKPSKPVSPSGGGGGSSSSIGNFFNSLGGSGSGSGAGSSALNGILSSLGGNSNQGGSSSSGLSSILGNLGGSLLTGGGNNGNSGGSSLTGLLNQFTGNNNRGSSGGSSSNGQQGSGSSFLSSLGGALAGSLIQNALNPKNNGDGGAGGVNTRRFGGLFSENPSSGGSASGGGRYASGSSGTSSTSSVDKEYPTQPLYSSDSYAADRRASSDNLYNSGRSYRTPTQSPVQYGWNV